MNQELKRAFAHIDTLQEKIREAQLDIDRAQNRLRSLSSDLVRDLEALKRETQQASEYSASLYIPPDLAREIRRIAGKVPIEASDDDD